MSFWLSAAAALRLHGRARHAAITAEYAAVAGLGFQQDAAAAAFMKENAAVGWHLVSAARAALRAGDDAFEDRQTQSQGVLQAASSGMMMKNALSMYNPISIRTMAPAISNIL